MSTQDNVTIQTPSSSMTGGERRAAGSMAMIMATRMLGLFMIFPVFALYADEKLSDATPILIGLAIGAYGLTQALLQIPFGRASDRFGRKRIITIGLLLFALGSVVAAMADNIMLVIIGRALQGSGAVAAAIMALTADLTREEQRTKAMAMIGMSIGASFMLALVIGPLLNAWVGLPGIFWLTAVLALLSIAILWLRVPDPVHSHTHRDAELVPNLVSSVLTNTQLLRLDAGILILHAVLTASFITIPFILRDTLAIEPTYHSVVYLLVLLFSGLTMVPFIIIAEKYRRMKMIFTSAIALLGFSLLGMSQWYGSFISFMLLMWLFFTAFNFLEASLPSLVTKIAPADHKGTAMGMYSSSQFIGAFIGGSGGGYLFQHYGAASVFLLCAMLLGVWWLLAITMKAPRHLSSLVVNFHEFDTAQAHLLVEKLMAISGVAEAVVIAEEGVAYLKVDNRQLDRESLQTLINTSA